MEFRLPCSRSSLPLLTLSSSHPIFRRSDPSGMVSRTDSLSGPIRRPFSVSKCHFHAQIKSCSQYPLRILHMELFLQIDLSWLEKIQNPIIP